MLCEIVVLHGEKSVYIKCVFSLSKIRTKQQLCPAMIEFMSGNFLLLILQWKNDAGIFKGNGYS